MIVEWPNYSSLLLGLSFAFCLSLTAGGILVIFRHRHARHTSSRQYLQYYLVFGYVFGYYGLWSGILLPRFIRTENVEALIQTVAELGVPFYIISLIMLIIWAAKLHNKPLKFFMPLTSLLSITAVLGFMQWGDTVADTIRASYAIAGFVVAMVVAALFIFPNDSLGKSSKNGKRNKQRRENLTLLPALIGLSGLNHLSYFTELAQFEIYETVFVFLFFLFNTAFVIVFSYMVKTEQVALSFDEFFLQHNITKREADIVNGIYAGKTNQEIADQLFISLQTVKDHSSRIYQKTQLKNRSQLAARLREIK